jgi:hypothetical protein
MPNPPLSQFLSLSYRFDLPNSLTLETLCGYWYGQACDGFPQIFKGQGGAPDSTKGAMLCKFGSPISSQRPQGQRLAKKKRELSLGHRPDVSVQLCCHAVPIACLRNFNHIPFRPGQSRRRITRGLRTESLINN